MHLNIVERQRLRIQERLQTLEAAVTVDDWSEVFRVWCQCCDLDRTPAQNRFLLGFAYNAGIKRKGYENKQKVDPAAWIRCCLDLAKEVQETATVTQCWITLAQMYAKEGNWARALNCLTVCGHFTPDIGLLKFYCEVKLERPHSTLEQTAFRVVTSCNDDSLVALVKKLLCIGEKVDDDTCLAKTILELAFKVVKREDDKEKLFKIGMAHFVSVGFASSNMEDLVTSYVQWASLRPNIPTSSHALVIQLSAMHLRRLEQLGKLECLNAFCEPLIFLCMLIGDQVTKERLLLYQLRYHLREEKRDSATVIRLLDKHKIQLDNPKFIFAFLALAIARRDLDEIRKCFHICVSHGGMDVGTCKTIISFVVQTFDAIGQDFVLEILLTMRQKLMQDGSGHPVVLHLILYFQLQNWLSLSDKSDCQQETNRCVKDMCQTLQDLLSAAPEMVSNSHQMTAIAWNLSIQTTDSSIRYQLLSVTARLASCSDPKLRLSCRVLQLASCINVLTTGEVLDISNHEIQSVITECELLNATKEPGDALKKKKRILACYKLKLAMLLHSAPSYASQVVEEACLDHDVDDRTLLALASILLQHMADNPVLREARRRALMAAISAATKSGAPAYEVAEIYRMKFDQALVDGPDFKVLATEVNHFTTFLGSLSKGDVPQEIVVRILSNMWNAGIQISIQSGDPTGKQQAKELCLALSSFAEKYAIHFSDKLQRE